MADKDGSPTPYYEDEAVTLYHGDCRDILPHVAASVTITDPPYNVGKAYGDHHDGMSDADYQAWLGGVLAACPTETIVWFPGTANLFSAPGIAARAGVTIRQVLGWHKREYAGDKWGGGPAMCWEPVIWASRSEKVFTTLFGARGRDFLLVSSTHGDPYRALHPCPKPLTVMAWLVGLFTTEGAIVLDPFAGTGTTLRAAKDAGHRAIGIELEERYCEAAVRRLAQEVLV